MKKHKNYDEELVVKSLNRKHDVFVPREEKRVFLLFGPSAVGDFGIGSKGKVDFLRKYRDYTVIWTTKF